MSLQYICWSFLGLDIIADDQSSCKASRKSLAMALQSPAISVALPNAWLEQLQSFEKIPWNGAVIASQLRGCTAQDLLLVSEEDFHGLGLQLGKIVLERQVEILQTVGLPELAGQLTGAQLLEFSHLNRVVDPHWFNADADPDPVPNPGFWWQKTEKNYNWKKSDIFLILIRNQGSIFWSKVDIYSPPLQKSIFFTPKTVWFSHDIANDKLA